MACLPIFGNVTTHAHPGTIHSTVWLVSELNKMLWRRIQPFVAVFLFLIAATKYLMGPTEAGGLSWFQSPMVKKAWCGVAPRWQDQEAAACWHLSEPGMWAGLSFPRST